MSQLTELTLEGVATVVDRMREVDWTEISNQSPNTSRYAMAWGFYTALRDRGRGRIVWHHGRPVCVVGVVEDWPGVWSICLFGTNEIKHVVYPALKWLRLTIGEVMRDLRGHRLYADSRFDHHEAHALLERMGGRVESVMPSYGADGSTYLRYVWIRGEGQEAALSSEGREIARKHVRIKQRRAATEAAAGAADRTGLLDKGQPDAKRHGSRRTISVDREAV